MGSCTAGHAGMFIWCFFSLDCSKALLLHTFAIETNLENVVKQTRMGEYFSDKKHNEMIIFILSNEKL